jgi:hypothetical protein
MTDDMMALRGLMEKSADVKRRPTGVLTQF